MLTFGTLIKVIAGFYLGCVGSIQSNSTAGEYRVALQCRDGLSNVSEQWEDLGRSSFRKINKSEYDATINGK